MPHRTVRRTARPSHRYRSSLAVAASITLVASACTADDSADPVDPGTTATESPLDPGPDVEVEPVLEGLSIPWDVVRAPDGTIVTGERDTGEVHAMDPAGDLMPVEADFGEIFTGGESGLMGLALAADFDSSREVYTCHSSVDHDDNRVTSWRAADDWSALESPEVLVDDMPLADGGLHSGCRILAHPDGTLYIGTGDAFTGPAPQDPESLGGKILHINRDGTSAVDTPVEGAPADSPVLTYGHRNVQGLALRPGTGTDPGQLIAAEHGPDVDDEVNLVQPGANYGWDPDSDGDYGQNVPMTDLDAFPDALEAAWSSGAPTLAPAGIAFLDDPAWGEWNGALAVAMLKTQQIVLMQLNDDGTEVTETSTIIRNEEGRIRSITTEPGGTLLATTSNGNGDDRVVRISPAAAPQE